MSNRKFTHPYNKDFTIERLRTKYRLHKSLIVGYDFDHTIFDYDGIGGDFSCVIDLLRECSELGFTMCLYTAEHSQRRIQEKIEYCKELGLNVDYVNESPALAGTKKPYFNILLDDTAGLEEAFHILATIVDEIKEGKL